MTLVRLKKTISFILHKTNEETFLDKTVIKNGQINKS